MHKIIDVLLARFSICRGFRTLSSADFFQSFFTQLFCRKELNRFSFVLCILSDYLETALNQTWKANTVRQEFHQKPHQYPEVNYDNSQYTVERERPKQNLGWKIDLGGAGWTDDNTKYKRVMRKNMSDDFQEKQRSRKWRKPSSFCCGLTQRKNQKS